MKIPSGRLPCVKGNLPLKSKASRSSHQQDKSPPSPLGKDSREHSERPQKLSERGEDSPGEATRQFLSVLLEIHEFAPTLVDENQEQSHP